MNNSRLEKLKNIPEKDRYPRDFPERITIKDLSTNFAPRLRTEFNIPLTNKTFKIAGRILAQRDHGNNIFFDLMDQTGSIQLHAKRPDKNSDWDYDSNEKLIKPWEEAQNCDLGDIVGVEGTLTANPRGEPLLLISNWTLLAKALIEPPDKHKGITEPEVKYRHRERDLLSSADSRALFKTRAEIVFEIRKYLNALDFIEIECPVLQHIYGGATARPFKTHHNALDQEFFLSISSELYLKRAMVGGFDRVYSFSRCFRNEGISPEHNPEFTNLEIFETCKTDIDMKSFVSNLIIYLEHRFTPSWVTKRNILKFKDNMPSQNWPLSRRYDNKCPKDTDNDGDCGRINCPYCGNPDFRYADAWELYINGMEIASGASDLNDPFEQEKRLKESEKNANNQIEKSHKFFTHSEPEYDPYDKNYIEALEMGALPWAGVGIGIDRLVMLLTGKNNIRDVVMFPMLKKKGYLREIWILD